MLLLLTSIAVVMFAIFAVDVIKQQFETSLQGLLVTGGILLVLTVFVGWRTVVAKAKRKVGG